MEPLNQQKYSGGAQKTAFTLSCPMMEQTASLVIQPVPYSARFGCNTKGEPPSPPSHHSIETAPSLLLAIFLDQSYSSAGVHKSF